MNQKGQVTPIVTGVGGLIIISVITLIIVSTILGANLIGSNLVSTVNKSNEIGSCNTTGYTLSGVNSSNSLYTIISVKNYTDDTVVLKANCSTSAAGVLTNASTVEWNNLSINYSLVYTRNNSETITASHMGTNLTSGIDEVSKKVPTILLIAAIVILFGVLVILVQKVKGVNLGSGSGSL